LCDYVFSKKGRGKTGKDHRRQHYQRINTMEAGIMKMIGEKTAEEMIVVITTVSAAALAAAVREGRYGHLIRMDIKSG